MAHTTTLTRSVAAAAASVALLLTACSSGDDGSGTGSANPAGITIGIAMTSMDPWLGLLGDATLAEAKSLGVEGKLVSAEADAVTQLSQVQNFITQGVSALVVNPVDTEASETITSAAKAAGIPLVYVNRCPENLPANVPCVGSDSVEAGELLMNALAELKDFKGTVAILEGDPTNNGQAVRERTQGCQSVIEAHPDMKLIKSGNGKWKRDTAMNVTENWLQSGEVPDMICANNDEMALGAINAVSAAGMLDRVYVGGIDATQDALQAMSEGTLKVTVFQDPVGQGSQAVQAAVKLVKGEPVETFVNVPFELVTPENMADFKK